MAVTDSADPRPLATVPDSPGVIAFSVAFSPDGHTLAVASADGLTRLWDISNPGRPVKLGRPLAGPASYAISVALSRTVTLSPWAARTSGCVCGTSLTWPGRYGWASRSPVPPGYVYSVAFSPDGRTLAAGVTDGTVWLWRVTDPARPTLVAS